MHLPRLSYSVGVHLCGGHFGVLLSPGLCTGRSKHLDRLPRLRKQPDRPPRSLSEAARAGLGPAEPGLDCPSGVAVAAAPRWPWPWPPCACAVNSAPSYGRAAGEARRAETSTRAVVSSTSQRRLGAGRRRRLGAAARRRSSGGARLGSRHRGSRRRRRRNRPRASDADGLPWRRRSVICRAADSEDMST